MTRLRALVLHAEGKETRTLAYQGAWPRHLAAHERFECTLVDVRRFGASRALDRALRRRDLDIVVILHSVFSNEPHLRGRLLERVARAPQPKAVFLGNEYKLMPEKLAYCDVLAPALLVTQLSDPRAAALYRERLGCEVAAIPSGGLDRQRFRPEALLSTRVVGIGYRAYENPWYLGHDERRELAERAAAAAREAGLAADVSLDPADRFDEPGWAAFLNRYRGQLGTEAGGDRFELTDRMRKAVGAYLADHPDATFADVRAEFFSELHDGVSGRALSGRVVEAAGTKTVQLLLEGEYGGYFRADEHYIPVQKDFGNLTEAVVRLRDDAECKRLVDAAYDVATTELTYERLIGRFADALEDAL